MVVRLRWWSTVGVGGVHCFNDVWSSDWFNLKCRHFPETGFVDNRNEATDVLVCWDSVCSEAEDLWHQLWDRWLSIFGVCSVFTQLTRSDWSFSSFETELEHKNTQVMSHNVTSPVLHVCGLCYFQSRQALNRKLLLTGSQPVWLVLPGCPRSHDMTGPLCPACCTPSFHW